MTSGKKPSLRQRSWTGDKADARQVGESLRGMDAAITRAPQMRCVSFLNQVYTDDGLSFAQTTRPLGVLCIHAETAAGTLVPASVNRLEVSNGAAAVGLSGLTSGERYATIRLLVIS